MSKRILAVLLLCGLCSSLCACTAVRQSPPPAPTKPPARQELIPAKPTSQTPEQAAADPTPVAPQPSMDTEKDPAPSSDLVVDYIGPDGRDSRLTMMENQSILQKASSLVDLAYKDENILVSPLSIFMAMGMAADGADTETKEDFESFLGMSTDEFDARMKAILTNLLEKNMTKLEIANGIWVKEGAAQVSSEYQSAIDAFYLGKIQEAKMDASTVGEINGWVAEKTHDMIPSIISNLSPDTIFVLVNALYFDAPWFDPYDEYSVSDGTFHGFDEDVTASFMASTEGCYMENDHAVAFEKSYYDGYSFIGILPKEEGEFDLQDLDLDSILSSRSYDYDVHIKLPKFEFESSMELSSLMKEMGLLLPFSDAADFSRMFSNLSETVKISQILHKTKIEVTETGTKAAAATAISMETCGIELEVPEEKEVFLDRPFAFVIMDTMDQDNPIPLFVGKVTTV